jgi:hypothetical protein
MVLFKSNPFFGSPHFVVHFAKSSIYSKDFPSIALPTGYLEFFNIHLFSYNYIYLILNYTLILVGNGLMNGKWI